MARAPGRHRAEAAVALPARRPQALEDEAKANKEKEKELVGGNPLLALTGDATFNLKRRCVALHWACRTQHAGRASECAAHVPRPCGDSSAHRRARRWDDDVVFKNQTRNEPKAQKRFINDTIRNDFHKRFLQKYIR